MNFGKKLLLFGLLFSSIAADHDWVVPDIEVPTVPMAAHEWVLPENIDVPTVYFPGISSSFFTQIARYTGKEGFVTLNGEHVYCTKGIHTIKNPCLLEAEPDDVEHLKPLRLSWFAFCDPRVSLKVLWKKLYFLSTDLDRRKYGVKVENISPEESVRAHYASFATVNFAQDRDIQNHKRKFDVCAEAHPDAPKILYGVSRGAATTFRACAQHADAYQNVRLVILEGCFDDIPHTLKARFPNFCSLPGMHSLLHNVLTTITSYKKNHGSPLGDVDRFPKDLPVVFITSEADAVVPSECTKKLVTALVNAGHKQVYLLTLKASSHSKYMMDNGEDATAYQNFIHALYKKYDLPYIAAHAEQGEGLVEAALVIAPAA